ncbi:MAG: hypothetical protein K0Q67_1243 [Cellvibrio sp.]|jgi:hypothetical protein|nr:hypothetical protein [Cellvibrio sp.]MDF3014209.1 hypothetical protein [Cellvibrio sp.]
MKQQHPFFKRNGLLVVFVTFMLISLVGQAYTGWEEYNQERQEQQLPAIAMGQYLVSGHFIQTTFENWESEFLQMGMYVFMTVFLFQQGSAESKSLDEPEAVDRKPQAHQHAPWPVRKGGIYLAIYQNSLSLVFLGLFITSLFLHAYGTLKNFAEEGKQVSSYWQVFLENRFWFESFQNWQSEFLSVAAIVFFSIYLRQHGSPESKPVDAPHSETGK